MLEPYEGKLSRTVLRRERGRDSSYLADYLNMCSRLEGTVLKIGPNSGTYINIFDIREESLEDTEKDIYLQK